MSGSQVPQPTFSKSKCNTSPGTNFQTAGNWESVHREREGEEGHHNTPSLQAPAQGSLTFIRVALKNVFKATQMFLNRGRVGVNSLKLLGTPNSYVSMAYVWPF